jgi:hypothetical protein
MSPAETQGVQDYDWTTRRVLSSTFHSHSLLLASMPRVLLWLSRRSSGLVFAVTCVVFLIGTVLDIDGLPWPVRAVGAVLATTIFFGYPFVIVFGFPATYSSVTSRRIMVLSALVLVIVCVGSVIDPHSTHEAAATWSGRLFGLLFAVLVISPFFIATHVLGEVRRAQGVYKPLDSIGAWFSLIYFGIGGVFFLHRSVASAAESIATERRTHKGIGNATAV